MEEGAEVYEIMHNPPKACVNAVYTLTQWFVFGEKLQRRPKTKKWKYTLANLQKNEISLPNFEKEFISNFSTTLDRNIMK